MRISFHIRFVKEICKGIRYTHELQPPSRLVRTVVRYITLSLRLNVERSKNLQIENSGSRGAENTMQKFISHHSVIRLKLLAQTIGYRAPEASFTWIMACSGMLRRVDFVRTDVSEEHIASIIRVTRISVLGTLAVTSNQSYAFFRNVGSYKSQTA
jgi:hypothetical protein